MKKRTSFPITLIGCATLLLPMASAQVAGAASTATQSANAAAAAARNASTASVAAQNAASTAAQQSASAASQGANVSAQAAANSAANASHFPTPNSPAVTGATSTGAAATTAAGATLPRTNGTVNAGMANSTTTTSSTTNDATRKNVNVDATTDVDVNGTAHARGVHANASASGQIATSLNTAETTLQIRNATAETRASVIKQVNSSIETSHVALAQLRQTGRELHGDARQEFNAAYDLVRTREQALRDSARRLQRASADTSAAAQAQLAADYQAYADAVAAAETVIQTSASTSVR